ncbi:hypothetical protein SAMN05660836_01064 [Thermodesulforhabdus norvegica]|uniref:Uncharacterized protein n=1 Tax=Thermodesulforhabdus norvegica TaxID=39841 RepID=A0A1I4SN73_9BACT|nr:hypothetical protein SAMN05660836_01064 [Thermodesulforhabdus norvegica]
MNTDLFCQDLFRLLDGGPYNSASAADKQSVGWEIETFLGRPLGLSEKKIRNFGFIHFLSHRENKLK